EHGAVVVPARVVDVPPHHGGREPFVLQPLSHGHAVERRRGVPGPEGHRDRESAGGAELGHPCGEAAQLLPVARAEADRRLQTVLPCAVQEQALLRIEAEIALLPLPVAEDAELLEKLPDEHRPTAGDRHIMRAPGVRGDLVLAPARVPTGALLHLHNHKVAEPALVEPPGGREPGDTAPDNDERYARRTLRRGEGGEALRTAVARRARSPTRRTTARTRGRDRCAAPRPRSCERYTRTSAARTAATCFAPP